MKCNVNIISAISAMSIFFRVPCVKIGSCFPFSPAKGSWTERSLGSLAVHMLQIMSAVLDRRHADLLVKNRTEVVDAVVTDHRADLGRGVIACDQQVLRLPDPTVNHELNR